MAGSRSPEELERELLRRLDPKGEFRELQEGLGSLLNSRLGRGFLRVLGADPTLFEEPLDQARAVTYGMARAVQVFAPAGWAPSSRVPIDAYGRALRRYEETGSLEEAESILVEGWNMENFLRWMLMPIRGLAKGRDDFHEVVFHRVVLVEKALEHHVAGAYEASVPIVLAQVDGIVRDLTGQSFYEKRPPEHLRDRGTVAGIDEGLSSLTVLFSKDMRESGVSGVLSRHGILHGRELGYDSLINSTKCFVLLVAVVEWADPIAERVAMEAKRARLAKYSGVSGVDEYGRQLDRRGFDEAKQTLRETHMLQQVRFRVEGSYAGSMDELLRDGRLLVRRERMPVAESVHVGASETRMEYWAWCVAATGFCLGISGRDGDGFERLYADDGEPMGGPANEPLWVDELAQWPPDWE
jgi:hypothetical protein